MNECVNEGKDDREKEIDRERECGMNEGVNEGKDGREKECEKECVNTLRCK